MVIFLPVFLLLIPLNSYAAEDLGKLEITANFSPTGDRAGPYGIVIKIYKDEMKEPYRTLFPAYTYPYFVTDLPLHHKYIIETYVNDQLSDIVRLKLDSPYQKIITNVHFPAGLKFYVFYNDDNTPIPNAVVNLFSHNGTLINHDLTDTYGRTGTAWIAPNIYEDGHYIATISLGDGLEYDVGKIRLLAGEQRTIKVVTPWPKIMNSLLTVTVYENKTKIIPVNEKFVIELLDSTGTKISESQVDHRGRAFFSLMPVGNYLLHIETKLPSMSIWENQTITIAGKEDSVQLFLADLCYLNCVKSASQTNHLTSDSHTIVPYLANGVLPECCFTSDSIYEMAQDLKHNANLWAKQKINDAQFTEKMKIILTEKIKSNNGYEDDAKIIIPEWLKTNAKWASEGKISDLEFAQSIEYLMQNNILIV